MTCPIYVTRTQAEYKYRPQNYTLAIVKHRELTITETFIRAHVTQIPTNTVLIQKNVRKRYSELAAKNFYLRIFREKQPHAVLAEYGKAGVLVLEACKELNLPLIVHFHGVDAYHRAVLEQLGDRYRDLFEYAAAVVAVSRHMEMQLSKLGAPYQKIHYIPCGVDACYFSGAEPAASSPVFLAVGRFVETKAPHLTVLAFGKARKDFPSARLVMIGEGHLLDACQSLAMSLGIGRCVSFLGPKPHSTVRDHMREARAFVQHSITTKTGECEGTPVSILEAGACGLPVIATRHGGIVDAIVDYETGLLVDELRVQEMADRILMLCEDPNYAAQLGTAARQRIIDNYLLESSIAKLWAVIRRSIDGSINQ